MNQNSIALYMIYYNQKNYFMCHEVLEEQWRSEEVEGKLNKDCGYVCLIQFAVSLHHLRNNNLIGYRKMISYLQGHYNDDAKSEISKYIDDFDYKLEQLYNLKSYAHIDLEVKYDLSRYLEYINEDKVLHTFSYANIENCNVLLYSDENRISGYITNKNNHLMVNLNEYASKKTIENVSEILMELNSECPNIVDFTGSEQTVDLLVDNGEFKSICTVKKCYLASLQDEIAVPNNFEFVHPKDCDVKDIIKLKNECFNQSNEVPTDFNRDFSLIYKNDNEIVFNASCTDYNQEVSMIIGVCTKEEYRGKGLAYEGVSKLCKLIQQNNCVPVLFFYNPKAASIYYKIGFKDHSNKYCIVNFNKDVNGEEKK